VSTGRGARDARTRRPGAGGRGTPGGGGRGRAARIRVHLASRCHRSGGGRDRSGYGHRAHDRPDVGLAGGSHREAFGRPRFRRPDGSARRQDRDLEGRRDLGVQAYADLVLSGGLDRGGQLQPSAVERRPTGRLDRLDDLRRRDRPEQTATGAGPRRQAYIEPGQLLGDLGGVLPVTDLACLPGAPDGGDILLPAPGPPDRVPPGEQGVAPVPALALDHVPGRPEPVDLLLENDLHRGPRQRLEVVYGSSAISRAFLIARAISRCCWLVTPVTRRARILPRSEMNFRSSAVSL